MAQAQPAGRREGARELANQEMYVTYDLAQRTRGGGTAVFPKVKRVYIPGDVVEWAVGRFRKRSGRVVYGVRITYQVRDESAPPGSAPRRYTQVIDLPDAARSVQLHEARRPPQTRGAVRAIR